MPYLDACRRAAGGRDGRTMARREYRVSRADGLHDLGGPDRFLVPPPKEGWTAASAAAWARIRVRRLGLPAGTRLYVDRRGGPRSPWTPFRRYVVSEDGIVRRLDPRTR